MGLHQRHRHEKASYAANGHYTDARWWMSECMDRQKQRLVPVRQPASEVQCGGRMTWAFTQPRALATWWRCRSNIRLLWLRDD